MDTIIENDFRFNHAQSYSVLDTIELDNITAEHYQFQVYTYYNHQGDTTQANRNILIQ